MSSTPASVLIVRLSSIGDVVHTIPAYLALRRSWPEASFGWAVESAAAELVRRLPGRLQVHELDIQGWRRSLLSGTTRRAVRAAVGEIRRAGYELAIDFQGLVKSALVARAARTPVLGFARGNLRESLAGFLYHRTAPAVPGSAHVIHRNLSLARAAGAQDDGAEFAPLFDEADSHRVATALRELDVDRFAVMHSAANWPSKRYPDERYVSIARALGRRTGLDVLWIWGPGERDRVERLVRQAGDGSRLAPQTSLPQLAALIDRARLFVGGDSAPLHIAGAHGTPAVAIFGPTDPARQGTLNPADEVATHVLPCSHCHRRTCPLGTRECLEALAPESVVEAAVQRLATAGAARE